MKIEQEKKASGLALIPFLVFIVIYVSAGVYYQMQGVEYPFYQFPSATAIFIATILAFIMSRQPVQKTFSIFAKHTGSLDVMTMLVIYLLAGSFSSVCTAMGARDDVVNLGLTFVPAQFLAAGIFVIAAFMGTATGSSGGTISALAPIAASIAEAGDLNVALVLGACIGGAMFGDNLSMISDTTIAATRTQHCDMKDKFRLNFLIALPAALITLVLLLVFGQPETAQAVTASSFSVLNVLPYVVVLGLALIGIDVFVTLILGLTSAILIGVCKGIITIPDAAQAIWSGFTGMDESFYVTFFCAGLAGVVAYNGGIKWLTQKLRARMKSKKSAALGLGVMVTAVDVCLANNTVAIILCGPIAREISEKFKIDPRKTASILDTFSCTFQGMFPWMAQVLMAVGLANSVLVNTTVFQTQMLATTWYCWILLVFAILSIFVPFADGLIKKDPWNWELDCPESKVAAKKAELAAEAPVAE